MSLILSWQNPLGLYDDVTSYRARVLRDGVIIEEDSVWGFHEVMDGLLGVGHYMVEYADVNGSQRHVLLQDVIDTWERPASACLISGDLLRPDGSADRGRIVSVTDSASDGMKFNRRYVSNSAGHIAFLLMPGAKVMIRTDGNMKAVDFCAPDKRDIAFKDITLYGSQVDTDRRGWY